MGLLDNNLSDQNMLGLSLLAAAGPSAVPQSFGQRLFAGLSQHRQQQAEAEDRAQRRKQQEMQAQMQQAQLAQILMAQQERQAAAQRQAQDEGIIRKSVMPLPGPNPDGAAGVAPRFDLAGLLGSGLSLGALPQAQQVGEMVNPRPKPADYKVVGGALVKIGGDGGVSEAYKETKAPDINALIIMGPDGKPMINPLALEAKRKIAAAGATNVSYGAPVAGQDPQGNPVFFQPSKGGGAPAIIPGVAPPAAKLGEKQTNQIAGIDALGQAIDAYVDRLSTWKKTDALLPDKRADMGTAYNNMMLQAKEAYNLGVLNGPDYTILQNVVRDPTNAMSVMVSNDALTRQATALKSMMNKTRQAVAGGKPTPAQPSSAAPKSVVRTGTDASGKKVVQYSDGSIGYAD